MTRSVATFLMYQGAADGNIYGSTYINQHVFRCDARSGKLTDLGKVVRIGGQVDSIHAGRDGSLYLGSYVLATLSIYAADGDSRLYFARGAALYRLKPR